MPTLNIDGPRACTKAELTDLITLVDVEMGRRGTDQTFLTDYPLAYEDENLENLRILRVDGEMASVVPFIVWPVRLGSCRFTMANISPTATAARHRMKGYGRQCLEDCSRRMKAIDCDISILRTKVETFPFYGSDGYQAVQNQAWIYPCRRDDAQRFTHHGEDIVIPNRLGPEQLAAVQAMHEAEGDGSVRSALRCAALFALPKMRTFLAYRASAPVAYLVVSNAINMPGLVEAGGDEKGVETLVHRALSELGEAVERNAHANLTPSVMANLLNKRIPDRRKPTAENRMIRINQPGAFFRRIAPWLENQNQGAEKSFSIAVAGETISFRFGPKGLRLGTDRLTPHLDLTRRQLVSAVFGAHPSHGEEPAPLGGLPPLYFPVWLLDRS